MIEQKEALAGLKVLISVAKADGILRDEERRALEQALEGAKLPDGVTFAALLDEPINLAEEIASLTSEEARTETYWAAVGLANADGHCSKEEQRLLERLHDELQIQPARVSIFDELVHEAKDTVLPGHIKKVDDPVERGHEVRRDMIKYAVMSGVLGAFPVPGVAIATDLAVVALQTKLVRDIGLYFGHRLDKEAAASLLAGVAGATGMRIAVSNVLKLVPGWGSIVGATSSFATTYGVGMVARTYFERGMTASPESLRAEFAQAKKQGEAVYRESSRDVDAAAAKHGAALKDLGEKLRAGDITRAEYERRVQALVET